MGWNPEKRPRERGFTKSGHDKLQRADVTVWTTIGVIALVDAGIPPRSGVSAAYDGSRSV
jgi:hypothetical protein